MVLRFWGWVWHLNLYFSQRLFFCGVSGLDVFLGASFCEVADLLAVPALRSPAFYHHHHLSFPAEYSIWDGLEALPRQTNPKYIVTMCCPGSRLQSWHILNVAVGTKEWGQDFACKECQDSTNCDSDSSGAHVFWLEPDKFCHYIAPSNFGSLLLHWQQDIPCCKTASVEILAWNAGCKEEFYKYALFQPS